MSRRALQVLITAQTLERHPPNGSILLLLYIVSHYHHNFLDLVLHKLKGPLYLLLVCLQRHGLRQPLQLLTQSQLLTIEHVLTHLLVDLLLQHEVLSLHRVHQVVHHFLVQPLLIEFLNLQTQFCQSRLLLLDFMHCYLHLIS